MEVNYKIIALVHTLITALEYYEGELIHEYGCFLPIETIKLAIEEFEDTIKRNPKVFNDLGINETIINEPDLERAFEIIKNQEFLQSLKNYLI